MTLLALVKAGWTAVTRELRNRATVRDLRTMTDAQLADIGIARDQIQACVYGERTERTQTPVRPVNTQLFSRTIRA